MEDTFKACIVCAMPLQSPEDYPGDDTSKEYCLHCGTTEGLKSRAALVKGMAEFIKSTGDLSEEEAQAQAAGIIDNSEAAKRSMLT